MRECEFEAGFVRDLLSQGMNLSIRSTNNLLSTCYMLGNVLGAGYTVVNNIAIVTDRH